MRKILSRLIKAIEEFDLISDGDKIAIGVSGGKDSMLLATAMFELKKFFCKKFEVKGFLIDAGGGKQKFIKIKKHFEKIGMPFEILNSNIFEVVFDERKEKNPCSLCSRMRRGQLIETAKAQGFNKLAMGHHADDLVDTFFISLFYEGRINTFSPKTLMTRTDIFQIRPFVYLREKEIINAVKKLNIPTQKNCCKAAGKTRRDFIKQYLEKLEKDIPDIKKRIFEALIRDFLKKREA